MTYPIWYRRIIASILVGVGVYLSLIWVGERFDASPTMRPYTTTTVSNANTE